MIKPAATARRHGHALAALACVVLAAVLSAVAPTGRAVGSPADTARWCSAPASACAGRAQRLLDRDRRVVRRWRAVARPYRGWLRSTSWCESGSAGHYRLRTTGNGFWFAFQFTASTWASVGGRRGREHRPRGRWLERVPSRAEQKYRAVRVLWSQGAGAWPVCG